MERYKDYAPTAFDSKGLGLPDQGDWYVVPVIRTRDSGPLEESNFQSALEMLGGESENVEVHRFGHWGPGWFEIILVDHDSKQAGIADDVERKLEDYPVLDDQDHAEREYDDACEAWDSWGHGDFCKAISLAYDLSDTAADLLRYEWDSGDTMALYCKLGHYESDGGGTYFPMTDDAANGIGRSDLARILRYLRNGVTNPITSKSKLA